MSFFRKTVNKILEKLGYHKKKEISYIEIMIKNREQERLQKAMELRNKTPKERWEIMWNFIRKYQRDKNKGYETEEPFEKILPFSEEEKEQWTALRKLAISCLNARQDKPVNKIENFRWWKDACNLHESEKIKQELKRLDKENEEVRTGRKRKKRNRRKQEQEIMINVTIST